ncbi:hypothetical protein P4O66_005872 [Electrophorus voltai]|uniref:Uncharacterized protein n=1 Tax=Electrophorus voltai TaxID=2609070 RepID=A0AAD8ZNG7_9TELE|nr:hypothetical protein P4O66_005872 [Electrophorus voltai]
MDVAVPSDGTIRTKEHEKPKKYEELRDELEKMWKVKATVVSMWGSLVNWVIDMFVPAKPQSTKLDEPLGGPTSPCRPPEKFKGGPPSQEVPDIEPMVLTGGLRKALVVALPQVVLRHLREWVNKKAEDRAVRVAEFSGVIHVSVRARKCWKWRDANAEMKSAFWTTDWQFQSPPATTICDGVKRCESVWVESSQKSSLKISVLKTLTYHLRALEFIITPPNNGHLLLKCVPSSPVLTFIQVSYLVDSTFRSMMGVNFAASQIFSITTQSLVLGLERNCELNVSSSLKV